MADVILYLGISTCGYILGMLLRKTNMKTAWLATAETLAVFVLIFTMGLRVGCNREVIESFGTIGLYAVIFTLVIMTCSALAVFLFRQIAGFDRYGAPVRGRKEKAPEQPGTAKPGAEAFAEAPGDAAEQEPAKQAPAKQDAAEQDAAKQKKSLLDSGTVRMTACVAMGILIGYFLLRFSEIDTQQLSVWAGYLIKTGLCLLLVFIGFDLGFEGKMLGKIMAIGPYAIVLPLVVAFGTLAGAGLCSLFLPVSLRESLAIGAGFGWYSLAPGLIMEAGYLTSGAVSFLHNVMRELFSILFVPLVARKIGYLEAVSLPGSPAMDVCLPVIVRSTNASTAIFSFACGFILSIMVPFVVPLFV